MQSIDWQSYAPGKYRIGCLSCGRGNKKDRTLGLTVDRDGGVAHCFRCSFIETFKPERGSVTRAPTIKPERLPSQIKHERLSDWGRSLWAICKPIDGVAAQYLKHRKCVIPPRDGHLRWHPSIKHPSGYVGPALVGLVTDSLTGEPLSLHRTWISERGKADVSPPRMPLANHSLKNGCIRLWPDDYVSTGLAVAEGVETALSLAHSYEPVWSLIDAGHLSKFPVIPGIECLTIARDNDPAGISAAHSCAARWVEAGRTVRITSQAKNDINDLLAEVAA